MKPAHVILIALAFLALSPIRARNRQANRQPGGARSSLKAAAGEGAILIGYWHDFVNDAGPLQPNCLIVIAHAY